MINAMNRLTFREPTCALVGGYAFAFAGIVEAVSLAMHPLPRQGFLEQFEVLEGSPQWGAIHIAITAGFAVCIIGGLLYLSAGGSLTRHPLLVIAWAGITVGLLFFSGTALINAFVMDDLARNVAAGHDRSVFDAFNNLLVGFGWIGDPLFLGGATALTFYELRYKFIGMPRFIAWIGFISVLIAWMRGPAGWGLDFLRFSIMANVPLFLWLGYFGYCVAQSARHVEPKTSHS